MIIFSIFLPFFCSKHYTVSLLLSVVWGCMNKWTFLWIMEMRDTLHSRTSPPVCKFKYHSRTSPVSKVNLLFLVLMLMALVWSWLQIFWRVFVEKLWSAMLCFNIYASGAYCCWYLLLWQILVAAFKLKLLKNKWLLQHLPQDNLNQKVVWNYRKRLALIICWLKI